jgi:transcriptional regulator with XRE-family HTH domain
MITSLQCRMARAALDWSNRDLAERASVGVNTVSRFEQGGEARPASIAAIQSAMEAAGVDFIPDGVRYMESGGKVI